MKTIGYGMAAHTLAGLSFLILSLCSQAQAHDNCAVVDTIHPDFMKVQAQLNREVIGQERLITRSLIAVLTGGHILVEGAPGTAKTTLMKVLSASFQGEFKRDQGMPDKMPSDLTGSVVNLGDGKF